MSLRLAIESLQPSQWRSVSAPTLKIWKMWTTHITACMHIFSLGPTVKSSAQLKAVEAPMNYFK